MPTKAVAHTMTFGAGEDYRLRLLVRNISFAGAVAGATVVADSDESELDRSPGWGSAADVSPPCFDAGRFPSPGRRSHRLSIGWEGAGERVSHMEAYFQLTQVAGAEDGLQEARALLLFLPETQVAEAAAGLSSCGGTR